ncbi:hypothetical protein DPX39_100140300 [Trypanosoma brucei equiperdum]|uniref:Uncharacterized protein n=1 Tax=Trypanosoma brucei equiperdum TaxID=630700 RepID=A0A3L6KW81_9TRYP|nr:hypothetical protein DPX39_100140300 [Trypanosoma brucei equiperdum]
MSVVTSERLTLHKCVHLKSPRISFSIPKRVRKAQGKDLYFGYFQLFVCRSCFRRFIASVASRLWAGSCGWAPNTFFLQLQCLHLGYNYFPFPGFLRNHSFRGGICSYIYIYIYIYVCVCVCAQLLSFSPLVNPPCYVVPYFLCFTYTPVSSILCSVSGRE